jgi:hypothetical protein
MDFVSIFIKQEKYQSIRVSPFIPALVVRLLGYCMVVLLGFRAI